MKFSKIDFSKIKRPAQLFSNCMQCEMDGQRGLSQELRRAVKHLEERQREGEKKMCLFCDYLAQKRKALRIFKSKVNT